MSCLLLTAFADRKFKNIKSHISKLIQNEEPQEEPFKKKRFVDLSLEEKREYNVEATRKHRERKAKEFKNEQIIYRKNIKHNLSLSLMEKNLRALSIKYEEKERIATTKKSYTRLWKKNFTLGQKAIKLRTIKYMLKNLSRVVELYPTCNSLRFYSDLETVLLKAIQTYANVEVAKNGSIEIGNCKYSGAENRTKIRKEINYKLSQIFENRLDIKLTTLVVDKKMDFFIRYGFNLRNLEFRFFVKTFGNILRNNAYDFKLYNKLLKTEYKILDLETQGSSIFNLGGQGKRINYERLTVNRQESLKDGEDRLQVFWQTNLGDTTIFFCIGLVFDSEKRNFKVCGRHVSQIILHQSEREKNSLRGIVSSTIFPKNRINNLIPLCESICRGLKKNRP
eukprot:maker-scaffold_13-snap-gene-8.3-mRNA-1 protein AED:0.06 eAED:0.06 QI:0/0.5/0.33/1/0/0/3/79/393